MTRAIALCLFLVVGCSTEPQPSEPQASTPAASATQFASATPSDPTPTESLQRPTGALDVVLRFADYPAMPFPGNALTGPPVFTLYGDGRAIYTTGTEPYDSQNPLVMRQAQLTDEQVDALIADALGPGGLAIAASRYDFAPEYSDQPLATFELNVGGLSKFVSARALGSLDEPGPAAAVHDALVQLAARLHQFDREVDEGRASDAGLYEIRAYEATLGTAFHELEPNSEWPWPGEDPPEFDRAPDGNLVTTMTPVEAAPILAYPGPFSYIATGPTGVNYYFDLRPLLPDQVE